MKLMARKVIARVLGTRLASPIATALSKAGLLGLGVGIHHEFGNSGESWLYKRLFRNFPSLVCLDIGANIGAFTMEVRSLGAGEVFAYEPVPETFAILENSVRHDKSVHIFQSAVGELQGTTRFFVPLLVSDSVLASRDVDVTDVDQEHVREIAVPITTVDLISGKLGVHIDFVKIDVEGFELEVLKGAFNTILTKAPAVIQFEFNAHHGRRNQTMRDFKTLLPNYKMFRLACASLRPIDVEDYLATIYTYQNIVCIHESARGILKVLNCA